MRARTCEYVKPNGHFCGSIALRGRDYCHFHLTYIARRLRSEKMEAQLQPPPLELPPLEDANSIQVAVMQVLAAAARGHLSPKLVGLMLYGLQIAGTNLRLGVNFSAPPAEETSEPVLCDRYDSFEQDYDIPEHAADLHCSAAEQQAEEERRELEKTWAREYADQPIPTGDEQQEDDDLIHSLLHRADEAKTFAERDDAIKSCYILAGIAYTDKEDGRAARRQKVLFTTRKPPASAAAHERVPQPVAG